MDNKEHLENLYDDVTSLLHDLIGFLNKQKSGCKLSPEDEKLAESLITRSQKQLSEITIISNKSYVQMSNGKPVIEEELATYVEADDLPPPLPPPPPSFENEEPEIPHDPHAITSTPITVPLLCTTQDDEICPFKNSTLGELEEICLKQGILYRKERFAFVLHKKSSIYVILIEHWLLIYEGVKKDLTPVNIIDVADYVAQEKSSDDDEKNQTFEIVATGKKTYEFTAPSHKEMMQWIMAITNKKVTVYSNQIVETRLQTKNLIETISEEPDEYSELPEPPEEYSELAELTAEYDDMNYKDDEDIYATPEDIADLIKNKERPMSINSIPPPMLPPRNTEAKEDDEEMYQEVFAEPNQLGGDEEDIYHDITIPEVAEEVYDAIGETEEVYDAIGATEDVYDAIGDENTKVNKNNSISEINKKENEKKLPPPPVPMRKSSLEKTHKKPNIIKHIEEEMYDDISAKDEPEDTYDDMSIANPKINSQPSNLLDQIKAKAQTIKKDEEIEDTYDDINPINKNENLIQNPVSVLSSQLQKVNLRPVQNKIIDQNKNPNSIIEKKINAIIDNNKNNTKPKPLNKPNIDVKPISVRYKTQNVQNKTNQIENKTEIKTDQRPNSSLYKIMKEQKKTQSKPEEEEDEPVYDDMSNTETNNPKPFKIQQNIFKQQDMKKTNNKINTTDNKKEIKKPAEEDDVYDDINEVQFKTQNIKQFHSIFNEKNTKPEKNILKPTQNTVSQKGKLLEGKLAFKPNLKSNTNSFKKK